MCCRVCPGSLDYRTAMSLSAEEIAALRAEFDPYHQAAQGK